MTHGKSVVVPVEPTEAMISEGRGSAPAHARSYVGAIWSAMLAAAPAPSSLAGGDVREMLKRFENASHARFANLPRGKAERAAAHDLRQSEYNASRQAILAALSPEAPARDGVVQWQAIDTAPTTKGKYLFCLLAWGPEEDKTTAFGFRFDGKWYAAPAFYKNARFDECQYELRQIEVSPSHWAEMPTIDAALTPRHEAPAEGAGETMPCPFCGPSKLKIDNWATWYVRCEDCRAEQIGLTRDKAISNWNRRARSSAPEAREVSK